MAIPDYPALMQPVLHALADSHREVPIKRLMVDVGSQLGLTREELAQRLPSGNETVFANRLQWALAYLEHAGTIRQHAQGACRSDLGGREVAAKATEPAGATMTGAVAAAKPKLEALLRTSACSIHKRLKSDLLARIHGECPEYFERLIIDLLLAMGYGCRRDLARHLGRRGDGGIDGAVPQDVLGLDVIYIQAKRYRPGTSVPVSAVREFAGSLEARKAGKGVFVTTAAFPKSAWDFVSAVPCKIVLIDGEALAELLIVYNIGVRVRQTYLVKEMDESYLARDRGESTSSGGKD